MIYLTGDLHGKLGIDRFNKNNFPDQELMDKNDYVIIAGDFGLLWGTNEENEELLDWLNRKPFTTLFIDGNHEDFNLLYSYPEEQWLGGTIRKIRSTIYHLERGQVFNLQGNKVFTFGGALSVDKAYRNENISWWKQEMPTQEEYDRGIKKLREHNFKVDMIITHTAPLTELGKLVTINKGWITELEHYLEGIKQTVKFNKWYFGHFHKDLYLGEGVYSMYEDIIRVK